MQQSTTNIEKQSKCAQDKMRFPALNIFLQNSLGTLGTLTAISKFQNVSVVIVYTVLYGDLSTLYLLVRFELQLVLGNTQHSFLYIQFV